MHLGPTGMICSVGHTAPAACAALRAGIAGLAELDHRVERRQTVVGARIPGLDPQLTGGDRLVEMLRISLSESLAQIENLPTRQVPLLIGLAGPEGPAIAPALAGSIVDRLQRALGVRFHPQHSQAICSGHTSALQALQLARDLLQNADIPGCLICAADSLIEPPVLDWLSNAGRLKTETNANGLIPGEAAAAIYVQRDAALQPPHVRVIGIGSTTERAGVLSDEPVLGLALAEAAKQALAEAKIAMHEVDFRLADVNGEHYGFKEHALALGRVMRVRRESLLLWHSADSIGDTGAAAGACQLVWAKHAFSKGYAPGPRVACFSSAVPGQRAVAILERIEQIPTRHSNEAQP